MAKTSYEDMLKNPYGEGLGRSQVSPRAASQLGASNPNARKTNYGMDVSSLDFQPAAYQTAYQTLGVAADDFGPDPYGFNDVLGQSAIRQEALSRPKSYGDQLNDIYNQIQNREKFSYDVNADPLYNAYKDKYVSQGKMAMQDTMGRAAALTGGYNSSYGQQVGQQTYNAYLQNLSDVIPELYSMAYQQYQGEGDRLKDLYSMAAAADEREYGRQRDAVSDKRYEDELARQLEQQEYERQVYADNLAYNKEQDARKNVLAMIQLGATPTDAELQAAGMSRAQAEAIHNTLYPAPAPAVSGGGGGYYGGSSGKTKDNTDTAQTVTATNYIADVLAAKKQGYSDSEINKAVAADVKANQTGGLTRFQVNRATGTKH